VSLTLRVSFAEAELQKKGMFELGFFKIKGFRDWGKVGNIVINDKPYTQSHKSGGARNNSTIRTHQDHLIQYPSFV
jgi:hypothetical protein